MPAYHSSYVDREHEFPQVGNFAHLPFQTKFRGPVPHPVDGVKLDIVDECIQIFRANCFFRTFEIKGSADRTLVYGILFIGDCLQKISTGPLNLAAAKKQLNALALESFAIPGQPHFPMNALYQAPADRSETDTLKQYMTAFRQELALRIAERVYKDDEKTASKWWLSFSRRRFMNKSLA